MACASCGTGIDENGVPRGCGSKGACGTGSCNKMSSYDWLSEMGIDDGFGTDLVEVSFKDGASKGFYHAPRELQVYTGDTVAVESRNGYNTGRITLSGELVKLQLKKKNVKAAKVTESVIRRANLRDLEKLDEARSLEEPTMIRARAMARSLHVNMKITDVEYQGDCRKVTIYYTSDERVDFRELVRQYAHQFRVKVEMRQIGPRQEAARLGGIGSCGRELCCSTWLSDFKNVNTAAARYQNLAINQTKLSGQCGRLKCCLNYELDTYMEALETFPKKADKIRTEAGLAILIKTDIFKGLMYYTYRENRGLLYPIPVANVHEMLALNREDKKPADLQSLQLVEKEKEDVFGYEDVTGVVELPAVTRRKKSKRKSSRTGGDKSSSGRSNNRRKKSSGRKPKSGGDKKPSNQVKPKTEGSKKSGSARRKRGGGRKPMNKKPGGE